MEFKKISINGVSYGTKEREIEKINLIAKQIAEENKFVLLLSNQR